MVSRSVALPALLAASVAVPYAATNAPDWDLSAVTQFAGAGASGAAGNSGGAALSAGGSPAEVYQKWRKPPQGPGLLPTTKPIEGPPSYSLQEVIRMDVSKEWVYARWPRKSTATADIDLFGVRVPLVSGTQVHDVAGALTYYFNPQGQVQKLTFRGRSGNPQQLAALAAGGYGLQPMPAPPGEQLWQLRWGPIVASQMRIKPAPVIWESSPHDVFEIDLVLQRPEGARPIEETNEAVAKMVREQQEMLARKQAAAAAAAAAMAPPPAPAPPPPAAAAPTQAAASPEKKPGTESPWNWLPRSAASDEQINELLQWQRSATW
jgi:hypothetical protein